MFTGQQPSSFSKEAAPATSLLRIAKMEKVRQEQKRNIRIEIPFFKVSRGDFIAIIGANGSGKSTFLDMLGLILSPDKIERFEFLSNTDSPINLNQLSFAEKIRFRRKHLAYVLQQGGLLEFLTVEENIRFAAQLNQQKIPPDIEQVTRHLDIQDILKVRPGKLSGGQRQKAAIARALVQQPTLILADEPTSSLDTQSAIRLMDSFSRLTSEAGTTLVMVTHDHHLVQNRASQTYHFDTREHVPGKLTSTLLSGTGNSSFTDFQGKI